MIRALCTCAALLVGAGVARAQDDQAFVSYRQNLMAAIGHDMAAIGDILKNGLPLTGNIAGHAQGIATRTQLVATAFEKKALGAPNDSKPEIWQEWAAFEKSISDLAAESETFLATARAGNSAAIGAGVQSLGKACGSCHDRFRKPKEQSYKRPGQH